LPYVTASAVLKAFVFSCRGHAAVPISSGLGWLLMSGSMSGLRREGTARGPNVRRCFGRCFAAGVRRIGASWFVSGWEALRGHIWPIVRSSSLRGRRGRVGVKGTRVRSPVTRDARRRCPSIPEKARALIVRDGRFLSLETRLGSG